MHDITIQGGEILASLDERTITGLLIPFGERSDTPTAGPAGFTVEAGSIALPADPSVVTLNTDHDRYAPVGRATNLWEQTGVGVMASFAIGRTPQGDAALADAINPSGTRRALSAEFKTDIDASRIARNGVLAGAALVKAGAFRSARVLAELAEEVTYSDKAETVYTDEEGRKYRRSYESVTTTEEVEGGTQSTTITTSTETEINSADTEEEPIVAEQETVQAGVIPGTLAPSGQQAVLASRGPDMHAIAAAIAAVKQNRSDRQAVEVLAALVDIVPADAGAAIQPNWMGDIAAGITYVQEYITLFNPGSDISIGGKKGYKVHRGTAGAPLPAPMDGTWAGNKTAIKSNKGFVTEHGSVRDNWAMGEDIGREFWDLSGGLEFVLAFLRMQQEDYLIWQDDLALAYAVAAAGAPVAPNAPALPANYPTALKHLIQGILAVKKRKADGRRDTPTFAVVNDIDYEELIYAAGGEQNLPAFVNIALSTDGKGTADGNVHIVNGDIGIEDTGAALVGASYAIDFDRPAGGLLEVDALDLARGGIDKAVHGYLQTFVKRPEALVLIGEADV